MVNFNDGDKYSHWVFRNYNRMREKCLFNKKGD